MILCYDERMTSRSDLSLKNHALAALLDDPILAFHYKKLSDWCSRHGEDPEDYPFEAVLAAYKYYADEYFDGKTQDVLTSISPKEYYDREGLRRFGIELRIHHTRANAPSVTTKALFATLGWSCRPTAPGKGITHQVGYWYMEIVL